jgi:hypothetical protein
LVDVLAGFVLVDVQIDRTETIAVGLILMLVVDFVEFVKVDV